MHTARRMLLAAALTFAAAVVPAGIASATGQPGTTAGVNCGTATGPNLPGHASSSPGAPFNEPAPIGTGSGGTAGGMYAGSGPGSAHAVSGNAVSQYDIACAH